MALTATELLEIRLQFEQARAYNAKELRRSRYGALDAFMADTTNTINARELARLKESSKQPTYINVYVKEAAGAGTARKCKGTGGATTAKKAVTFAGITEEFAISKLEVRQNDISEQELLMKKIQERMRSAHQRLDTLCAGFLETNKSPVNAGTIFADSTRDSHLIPKASENRAWAGIQTELDQNDHFGQYNFVADSGTQYLYNHLINQGPANDENDRYGLLGLTPYWTNRITNDSVNSVGNTIYSYSAGTIAIVDWINMLHREGEDIGTDIWTTFADPFYPFTWELKMSKECKDSSGDGVVGGEADLVTGYVMHCDFALTSAYSSTTETFIYKYEIPTS